MVIRFLLLVLLGFVSLSFLPADMTVSGQVDIPKCLDEGMSISLFAAEPDIVTPTGIAVDQRGRVFCIESHTHFRPQDYKGPKADRIRIYEDKDGDGKAETIKNFFEGTTATMNMAFAPDGSLYVATRAKIFRLVDTDNDDRADSNQLIVNLETKGNYPHNGLSGLAFLNGKLYFGFGENLGVDYQLRGKDGVTLSGGGEGGNIYCCNLDGTKLRHFATGFWNPFGLAFDQTGHLFAIDNDPDWRPPCRFLHIVEGGDYGYRFSHGRRGTHPFTSWFGEFPGTLGMVSGTGEAPSGIVRFDSFREGDSEKTHSSFLSTSWGLHSIERFDLQTRGASFVSRPVTVVKGKKDFRPVGIAKAPDGSLFVSDWCKRSYELHGHGRIWKITLKGKQDVGAKTSVIPESFPYEETDPGIRQLAAIQTPTDKIDFGRAIQGSISSLEKSSLIRRSAGRVDPILLIGFLKDNDPFIRQAARHALEKSVTPDWLASVNLPDNPLTRTGLALVMRSFSDHPNVKNRLAELLADADSNVRLVALKWIGEEKVDSFSRTLEQEITARPMTGKLFESYLAALDFLNQGRAGAEFEKAEAKILSEILDNPGTLPDTLVIALRKLQSVSLRDTLASGHPKLQLKLLENLLEHADDQVAQEAVQTIRDLGTDESEELLFKIFSNRKSVASVAKDALIGLNPAKPKHRQLILQAIVDGGEDSLVAKQILAGTKLDRDDANFLKRNGLTLNSLIRQPRDRTGPKALQPVLSRLEKADAERGRLVFHNHRFGQCAKCHQVDGRGGQIGPDLSNLATMSVERLLESILQPSKEIAPRHTSWLIQTYDGRTITGVLLAERGEVQTYADENGQSIQVKFDEIEQKKSLDKSIMPAGLLNLMTDQEIADLIKFLKKS